MPALCSFISLQKKKKLVEYEHDIPIAPPAPQVCPQPFSNSSVSSNMVPFHTPATSVPSKKSSGVVAYAGSTPQFTVVNTNEFFNSGYDDEQESAQALAALTPCGKEATAATKYNNAEFIDLAQLEKDNVTMLQWKLSSNQQTQGRSTSNSVEVVNQNIGNGGTMSVSVHSPSTDPYQSMPVTVSSEPSTHKPDTLAYHMDKLVEEIMSSSSPIPIDPANFNMDDIEITKDHTTGQLQIQFLGDPSEPGPSSGDPPVMCPSLWSMEEEGVSAQQLGLENEDFDYYVHFDVQDG